MILYSGIDDLYGQDEMAMATGAHGLQTINPLRAGFRQKSSYEALQLSSNHSTYTGNSTVSVASNTEMFAPQTMTKHSSFFRKRKNETVVAAPPLLSHSVRPEQTMKIIYPNRKSHTHPIFPSPSSFHTPQQSANFKENLSTGTKLNFQTPKEKNTKSLKENFWSRSFYRKESKTNSTIFSSNYNDSEEKELISEKITSVSYDDILHNLSIDDDDDEDDDETIIENYDQINNNNNYRNNNYYHRDNSVSNIKKENSYVERNRLKFIHENEKLKTVEKNPENSVGKGKKSFSFLNLLLRKRNVLKVIDNIDEKKNIPHRSHTELMTPKKMFIEIPKKMISEKERKIDDVKNIIVIKSKEKKMFGTDSTSSIIYERVVELLFHSPIFTCLAIFSFFFFAFYEPFFIFFYFFLIFLYHYFF